MKMNNLINCFEGAKKSKSRYVGVKIVMPKCSCPEVIINEYPNFDSKLEYYQNAYSDNLSLKTCGDIKIVGFTYGNSFDQIQKNLL